MEQFLQQFDPQSREVDTCKSLLAQLNDFLQEEDSIETLSTQNTTQCLHALMEYLNRVPTGEEGEEILMPLFKSLCYLDMVLSFFESHAQEDEVDAPEGHVQREERTQRYRVYPEHLIPSLLRVMVACKKESQFNVVDEVCILLLQLISTRWSRAKNLNQEKEESMHMDERLWDEVVRQFVVALVDLQDDEVEHVRHSVACVVINVVVELVKDPQRVLNDLMEHTSTEDKGDDTNLTSQGAKLLIDTLIAMLNRSEKLDRNKGALFVEELFCMKSTDHLMQLVYTSDLKIILQIITRELYNGDHDDSLAQLQLRYIYLRAIKSVMSHQTYADIFELFMYDEIMQLVQNMANKCKEILKEHAEPGDARHVACKELARACEEIESLNI